MKKFFFSALLALSTLSTSQAANLYSSNLGNGLTLPGASSGLTEGTVRFGIFPVGFDFAANVENFPALNANFTEVTSFSGPLTVSAVNGFYQTALTYSSSGTFEGTAYSTIAGQKVYIWVLNTLTPETTPPTQQFIASSNQTWASPSDVITDTFASPDTGIAGLTFHIGQAGGNDIGASAPSHILGGAVVEVGVVAISLTPNTPVVNSGTSLTLTATVTSGTPPLFYKWLKNGVIIVGQTNPTLVLNPTVATDTGDYSVLVSNSVSTDVASGVVSITVETPKPTILTQPAPNTILAVGDTLDLSVFAVAQGNITYQWKKGAPFAGETDSELSIPNVGIAQAGAYTVTVSNLPGTGTGSVNSAIANVVVVGQTPSTVVTGVNGSAKLTAIVGGKGATFQWFKEAGAVDTPVTGATLSSFTLKAVTAATSGDYYCAVTLAGDTVNSGIVTVKVFTAGPDLLAITGMPDGRVGASYFYQVPVDPASSKAPTSFAAKGLPTGLKINPKTGIISGRPLKATTSPATVTITVKNTIGAGETDTTQIEIFGFPVGLGGSYAGFVERQDVLGGELGGNFLFTISTTGVVSGSMIVGNTTYRVAGAIEVDQDGVDVPTATISLARSGLPPLTIGFELEDDYLVNGYLTDGTVDELAFSGWRNVFSRTAPATDFQGYYTMAMGIPSGSDDEGDVAIPQGIGYATFTIAVDGKYSVKGKLPDGEAITFSSFIGPGGDLYFYDSIYKTVKKGSVLGLASVLVGDTNPENTLDGAATWLRPMDLPKQRTYEAGFGPIDLIILGGRYVTPALTLGRAVNDIISLEFYEGAPTAPTSPDVDIQIQAGSKLVIQGANPAKTTIKVTNTTGLLSGGFTLADKRAGKFEGITIMNEGVLVGYGFSLLPVSIVNTSDILSGGFSLGEEPELP